MNSSLQQKASEKTDILPARFDTVTKLVVQRHPEAFVNEEAKESQVFRLGSL